MSDFYRRMNCRGCGSHDLVEIINFGDQPPANAFIWREDFDKEKKYPLVLQWCRACSLLQLRDVVDPKILFPIDYHYVTGTSPPMVEHFKKYAEEIIFPRLKSTNDLVVDIGGNDGTLLSFVQPRARTLNIDPAANLARENIRQLAVAFSSTVARVTRETDGPAHVITANNVFAHTDNIQDAFAGVYDLLHDEGTFIMEVHWVKHLIETCCYDQVYHEHLCFWSLHALKRALEAAGLNVAHVEVVPTQGQSLRVFANKKKIKRSSVFTILEQEDNSGLTQEATFHEFAQIIYKKRDILRNLLYDITYDRHILGFGAPAKGNTLLNFCDVGECITYLSDTTPDKIGKYAPGSHILVVSQTDEYLRGADYHLLLSWNYKDSIKKKHPDLRFIVPLPEITIE